MLADTPIQRLQMFVADWNAGLPNAELSRHLVPGVEFKATPQMEESLQFSERASLFPDIADDHGAFVVERGSNAFLCLRRWKDRCHRYIVARFCFAQNDWRLLLVEVGHLGSVPGMSPNQRRIALGLLSPGTPPACLKIEGEAKWSRLGHLVVEDELRLHAVRERQFVVPLSPVPHGRFPVDVLTDGNDHIAAAVLRFSDEPVVDVRWAYRPIGWGAGSLLVSPASCPSGLLEEARKKNYLELGAASMVAPTSSGHRAIRFHDCWDGSSHALWFWGLNASGEPACLLLQFADPREEQHQLPYPKASCAALRPEFAHLVDLDPDSSFDISIDHSHADETIVRSTLRDVLILSGNEAAFSLHEFNAAKLGYHYNDDIRDVGTTSIVDVWGYPLRGAKCLPDSCWRDSPCHASLSVAPYSADDVSRLLAGGLGELRAKSFYIGDVTAVVEEADNGSLVSFVAPTPTLSSMFIEAVSKVMRILADVGADVVAEGMYVEFLPGRGRLTGSMFRMPSTSGSGPVS